MKIKIKKIIASVLTFMMIFTQVPVNVFARIILRNILHGKMQVQKFVYNIIALK